MEDELQLWGGYTHFLHFYILEIVSMFKTEYILLSG